MAPITKFPEGEHIGNYLPRALIKQNFWAWFILAGAIVFSRSYGDCWLD